MRLCVAVVLFLFSMHCSAKSLTNKEYSLLALTIFHEARGESSLAQQAVLEVVLNRTSSTKSVKDVILAPYQFSFTMVTGWFAIPAEELYTYVQLVKRYEKNIRNGKRVLPKGTKYYHAHYVNPSWAGKMVKVASIGGHKFYKQTVSKTN